MAATKWTPILPRVPATSVMPLVGWAWTTPRQCRSPVLQNRPDRHHRPSTGVLGNGLGKLTSTADATGTRLGCKISFMGFPPATGNQAYIDLEGFEMKVDGVVFASKIGCWFPCFFFIIYCSHFEWMSHPPNGHLSQHEPAIPGYRTAFSLPVKLCSELIIDIL